MSTTQPSKPNAENETAKKYDRVEVTCTGYQYSVKGYTNYPSGLELEYHHSKPTIKLNGVRAQTATGNELVLNGGIQIEHEPETISIEV